MKYSELTIDGVTYRLGYDFNIIADLEPVCGCNLLSGIRNLGDTNDLTANQLRGLLCAFIRAVPHIEMAKDPAVTLREVGKLIRVDTIQKIYFVLADACAIGVSEEFAERYRAALDKDEDEPRSQEIVPGMIGPDGDASTVTSNG